MASVFYDTFFRDLMNGTIDLDTDTIKIMLVTSGYVADRAVHDKHDDITNEVVAAGYVAGGETLTTITLTVDTTNHRCVLDCDDITWTANLTARAAVVYKDTGVSATSPLIAYIDFGSDQTSSGGGDFIIQPSAGGLLYVGV